MYLVKVFIFASTALWRKQILVKAVPISFVAPEKVKKFGYKMRNAETNFRITDKKYK